MSDQDDWTKKIGVDLDGDGVIDVGIEGHLVSQLRHRHMKGCSKLHVIGVIQNPVRYGSRYRLFRKWAREMVATKDVVLHVVEAIYGDRQPECAPLRGEYNYYPVRTSSELWLKENLINLGVRHLLPCDWKYMAWVDCDVTFRDPNWALETIHQLQHYAIVQPWSDATDLTYDGGVHKHFKSFGYFSAKHMQQSATSNNPYNHPYGHTGFAWACTRYFYENVEKLIEWAILGSGDAHMAYGCIGRVQETINQRMQDGYKHRADIWSQKASYACGGIVGYTPGRLEHHFHGPKSRRQYASRWEILVKHKYNPWKDLRHDYQGVIKLKGKKALEHAIMRYNRERQEDSIEQY
jgi:hypothetical protein